MNLSSGINSVDYSNKIVYVNYGGNLIHSVTCNYLGVVNYAMHKV